MVAWIASFLISGALPWLSVASEGCGRQSPWASGSVEAGTVRVPGGAGPSGQPLNRSYYIRLPPSYDPGVQHPLLLFFHGLGSHVRHSAEEDGLGDLGSAQGWIVVHAVGLSDVPDDWWDGSDNAWSSWNGSGTVGSPGPLGPICASNATPSPCYLTCTDGCRDHCWWTTCADDVSFVGALLDHLESSLCIDSARIVASGYSNGGIFLFELAAHNAISRRLTAILSVSGLPHVGFLRPPASALTLMGIWGLSDHEVPGFHHRPGGSGSQHPYGATMSADGFYYHSVQQVVDFWVESSMPQGGGKAISFPTPYDGEHALSCTAWSNSTAGGSFAPVISCTWDGNHRWPQPSCWKSTPLIPRVVVNVFLRKLFPETIQHPDDGGTICFNWSAALALLAALLLGALLAVATWRRKAQAQPAEPYRRL